jgi:hypothetical protein
VAKDVFTFRSFLLRAVVAIVLVFATYNPEGYSYYHWALGQLPQFSILKGFVGVALLIGWTIYLRATLHSLGAIGTLLALAFFGTLLWLITDTGLMPAEGARALSYIVLLVITGVLSAGISWSHIRRRITGQIDVDDTD